jgi:hypothetical protein
MLPEQWLLMGGISTCTDMVRSSTFVPFKLDVGGVDRCGSVSPIHACAAIAGTPRQNINAIDAKRVGRIFNPPSD